MVKHHARHHLGILAASLIATPAWSMGIGEWQVRSHLGERAVAEAEILHEEGDLFDANCFQLVGVGAEADFPSLEGARLTLVNGPKGAKLRVTSARVVNEPIVQMRLKISCGATQTRDMVLLFSPKEVAGEPVQLAETAPAAKAASDERKDAPATPNAASAATASSAPAQATPATVAKAPAKALARPSAPAAPRIAQAGPKPAQLKPATRLAPAGKGSRLVLSGELDADIARRLRMSGGINSPVARATQEEREQLRLLYKTMMQLAELKEGRAAGKPGTTPAPSGALPGPTPPAAAPTPAPALTPPPESAAPVAPPPETTPAPTVATPQTPPQPAPPAAKAEAPQGTPLAPLGSLGDWWLPALGLLLVTLLVGLLLWFMRRRNRVRELPEPFEPMEPITKLDMHNETVEEEPAERQTLESLIGEDAPTAPRSLDAPEAPTPSATPSANPFTSGTPGMTVHSENASFQTSYRTMLDLAESMMAFGLTNDAADALKEYVEEHPQVALEPWIKLLDILRQSGNQKEFEAYSQRLKQNFNVELPSWDAEPNADGEAPSLDIAELDERFRTAPSPLEAFPHVRDRLVAAWPGSQCAQYLHNLMRDNRAGKRRGFPLSVVEDILLLLEINQQVTGLDLEPLAPRAEIFSDTW